MHQPYSEHDFETSGELLEQQDNCEFEQTVNILESRSYNRRSSSSSSEPSESGNQANIPEKIISTSPLSASQIDNSKLVDTDKEKAQLKNNKSNFHPVTILTQMEKRKELKALLIMILCHIKLENLVNRDQTL